MGTACAALLLFVAFGGVSVAQSSPPGCNADGLFVDLAQSTASITNGDTVKYAIKITNGGAGACDITALTVNFYCPGPTGAPNASPDLTLPNLSVPADGSGDNCYSSDGSSLFAGFATCVSSPPPTPSVGTYADLACAVSVSGSSATAKIDWSGTRLASSPVPSTGDKTITLTVNQAPPPVEFCRTPGFWGTHGDADDNQACSQNITGAVLAAAGGSISICGATISNTDCDSANSALEALCVRVQGEQTRQLARQLTAARLNCIVSGETGGACDGISINDVFDACNVACAAGDVTATVGSDEVDCIGAIDCFNNGGQFDNATGVCTTGTCSVGGAACGESLPCASGECIPSANSCHATAFADADFVLPNDSLPASDPCFGKQGPAASSEECKAANKSICTILHPAECHNVACPAD